MQLNDLVVVLGEFVFSGNTLVAGLMLTGLIIILLIGVMSLASPPPAVYILISFLGILIGMGLGWLDYWLAVIMGVILIAALSLKIAGTIGGT